MKKINTKVIAILALCLALNVLGSKVALLLKLPIYLDTIGTLFASATTGPIGGLIVGGLTSILAGLAGDVFSYYFMPVQLIVALAAGIAYKKVAPDNFKNIWWLAFVISIFGTIVSTTITIILFHGITSSGSSIIVQLLYGAGLPKAWAVFIVQILTDYLDRLVGVYVVALAYHALKNRLNLNKVQY